ncbi:DUF3993 domain-containing protein [Niallia circulans]|jgi:hypothetical protein|uniref:DUF3993 domain-containing protein n=1 Tax=Niallia TaxID=2837506 RepID=UPI00077C0EC3|nr:DUF3993 domain-containing protein [Niallia circulans]MCM2979625.1 DUF3993 domain-containing protein [Niallia circulans]MED3836994.1 DUF3993 domain-containing protein [Niallia circulans]MED4244064.1 DUF3993 domain-containing protein [Niallia circulans]MED4249202.1 DUF3993 domain-containing protein [Niallia circulans]PAD89871.1 DUF3993 domain-containing protein [Niallia circulans]
MKKSFFILLIISMWSVFPYSIDAASHLTSREEVFAFVEKAFRAQVSLSKEAREMEEIEEILTPYFSDKLIYLFLNENLTGEQGNFFTYGNEFGKYYLPFYQLSEQTFVEQEENSILLYEYYEPIVIGEKVYEGSYEGILIRKWNNKWLITNMLSDKEVRSILKSKEKNYSTLVYMPLFSIDNQVTYIKNNKNYNDLNTNHL